MNYVLCFCNSTVGEDIMFLACPIRLSFVRSDIVNMISHEWLQQL